jgi:2-methylcitrate dehydratase PrpD
MEMERIGPSDVEAMEVQLPGRSARTVDSAPAPNLNVQHLIAMLLIDGTLSFAAIHDQARMQDEKILALRKSIALHGSDELARATPRRQAIVTVKTRDGRSVSHRTFAVRGTADNPMTQAEIDAKAFGLIEPVLGARRANAILHEVAALDTVGDVAALRRLWQASNTVAPAPGTSA